MEIIFHFTYVKIWLFFMQLHNKIYNKLLAPFPHMLESSQNKLDLLSIPVLEGVVTGRFILHKISGLI